MKTSQEIIETYTKKAEEDLMKTKGISGMSIYEFENRDYSFLKKSDYENLILDLEKAKK